MRKILLIVAMLFVVGANAQKAYDLVIYKGAWRGFDITLNFADGYDEATTLVAVHRKTGTKKTYTFNSVIDNGFYSLSNPTNKTTYIIGQNIYPKNNTKRIKIIAGNINEDIKLIKQ